MELTYGVTKRVKYKEWSMLKDASWIIFSYTTCAPGSQSSDPFWTGASEGDQAVSTTSGQGPANPSTFRNVRNCRNEYEKLMNHEQNATTFRETFSLIKEAAIKAMAAIDMVGFRLAQCSLILC